MIVTSFTFNPFAENTYLLHDETQECVVIDPGCYDKEEQQTLVQFVKENNLKVVKLINTHCHVDHVLGNKFISDTYGVPLTIHEADLPTLRAVAVYAPSYGFNHYAELLPTAYFKAGEVLQFGHTELQIKYTPGHAPGHVVFYHEASQTVIGGDVLFKRSIGRTDLLGGDFGTLIQSIKTQLFTLPDGVTVYPGHGPETTIGKEKKHNPFLR